MKPGSRTFWDVFQGESWGPKLPAQWFALSLILQAYLDRVHGFSCHRYGRNFGRNWPLAVSTCRILSLSLSISLSLYIIYIYRANASLLYNVYIYDDSYIHTYIYIYIHIYICILTYTGVRAPSKLPRQSSGLLAQLLFGWTVISGAAQGRVNSIFMDILYYIYTQYQGNNQQGWNGYGGYGRPMYQGIGVPFCGSRDLSTASEIVSHGNWSQKRRSPWKLVP